MQGVPFQLGTCIITTADAGTAMLHRRVRHITFGVPESGGCGQRTSVFFSREFPKVCRMSAC